MHQEVKAANPSVGVMTFLCDSFYSLLLIITEHLIYVSLTFHTGKTQQPPKINCFVAVGLMTVSQYTVHRISGLI